MNIFDRVYVSVKSEFFAKFPSLCLEDIIDDFAKKKKIDEQGNELVINNDHVCRGRTKRYLLRRVNNFINDLEIVDADVDMKQCVSITQFNRLIRVFREKHGRITSYAMIIFHVLLKELEDNNSNINGEKILPYARALNEIACMIYRQYPGNELARFLVESGATLIDEITHNRVVTKNDFPGIPRRGAFDEMQ